MPIALNPKKTWEYQLREDRKRIGEGEDDLVLDPEKTVFLLRGLTADELADGTDGKLGRAYPMTGTTALKTVRMGLVGWRNFVDEDGNALTFTERAHNERRWRDNANWLTPDHLTELSNAIVGRVTVSAEEGN